MEINTLKYTGYIGMRINDCNLKDKINNVIIDDDYKNHFIMNMEIRR